MMSLGQDLAFAIRSLRRSRGFTIVAVFTLAIGIGLSTTIFTFVNALMIRPMPYRDAGRLVRLAEVDRRLGRSTGRLSPVTLEELRAQSRALASVAAYREQGFNLSGEGEPERVSGAAVSANALPMLGISPLLGRAFSPDEDRPGRGGVVMLSYGLWQRRFGGDPSVVGRTVRLDGVPHAVVGVMPEGVRFPEYASIWVPLAADAPDAGAADRSLSAIGRLAPTATLDEARAELATLARRLAESRPQTHADWALTAAPERPMRGEEGLGQILLATLGAVGFVLLIVCANVANLMLARTAARGREMAVRTALGASRSRLVRLLLTESLLLAAVATIAGVLLSLWGAELLLAPLPDVPGWLNLTPDWRVLTFAVAVTAFTTIAFGLTPALTASRPDLTEALKASGAVTTGRHGGRARGALIVAQLALAMVLLTGAALMTQGLARLARLSPAYDPRNLLTMQLSLPTTKYREPHAVAEFIRAVTDRVSKLPAVEHVATASGESQLTGSTGDAFGEITPEGGAPTVRGADRRRGYLRSAVTPDYFRVLRLPLRRGRFFEAADRPGAPGVAIVNEALAAELWPGQDPLGRQLKLGGDTSRAPWLTVVGVVANARRWGAEGNGVAVEEPPHLFLPALQSAARDFTLLVRTLDAPSGHIAAVREAVLAADPDQPVTAIMTMEHYLRLTVLPFRYFAGAFLAFAALALLVAAVGLYGVVAYSVSQRTREFGIRLALGARGSQLVRLIVRQGLVLAAAGVAIGGLGAAALTRLVAMLLYEVTPTDPATFGTVAAVLTAVGLLASYVPARRASRVSPMAALRYE